MFVIACLCLIQLLHGEVISASSGAGGGQDKADHLQTKTLYFLSLLPYPNPSISLQPSWDEGPSVFLAEQLAVDHINNRSDILPGYQIELIQADGGCNIQNTALVSLVQHVLYSGKQIVGVVGPGCSFSAITVAPLIQQKPIALVNFHLASASFLRDREKYSNSFGVSGSIEAFYALLALIKHNNWTRLAILYDESRLFYSSFQQSLQLALQEDPTHYITFSSAVYDSYIPLEVIEQEELRVIILLVGPDLQERIACLGYHRGFTFPKYQVITAFEQALRNTEFTYDGTRYYCDLDTLWKVANGNLVSTYLVQPLNTSQLTDTGFSYEQFSSLYEDKVAQYNTMEEGPISQSFLAPVFYDAVWALALALDRSIDPLRTKFNASLSTYIHGQPHITDIIRHQVESLDFEGISGRIQFDSHTGYVQRVVGLYVSLGNRSVILVGYFSNNELRITADSSVVQFIPDSFEEETDDFPLVKVLLTVLFLAFTILELLILMATHIISVIYRRSRSVKASSPKLNHLAFTGCYCLLVTIVSFIIYRNLSTTSFSCALLHIVYLTSTLGETLIFGVVLVRTWRLYRILVQFRNPGRFISDHWLIFFVLLMAGVGLLVNFLWIGVDHYQIETHKEGEKECKAKYEFVWLGVSIGYCAVITLAGVWYAVSCYNTPIPRKEFKTTSVIFLVYSNILIQAIGLPIYVLSLSQLDLLALATLCLVGNLLVLLYLIILFIPPIWPIIWRKNILRCCCMAVDNT